MPIQTLQRETCLTQLQSKQAVRFQETKTQHDLRDLVCKSFLAQDKSCPFVSMGNDYLLLVYLVTAFVPSLTACLDSSPGRCSLTAVWISRLVMVCFLL